MKSRELFREGVLEEVLGASAGAVRVREARRLLDRAVNSSADGIVITDATAPDNHIVFANPAFEAITGYAVEEAIGRNCRFLQGEDRDQPGLDELRAALSEGRECVVELRNYKKGGEFFWNALSVSPVRDEDGRIVNFVGVQSDVTERKEIEERLRQQAELLDLSLEPIFAWELDGGIVYWNTGCEELYGYSREEALGRSSHELLRTVHPVPTDLVEAALRREGRWFGEVSQTTREGRRVVVESRNALVDAADGRRLVLETNRDVTRRKRVEQELRESEDRLRLALEATDLGTWDFYPVTGEMVWDERCKRLFGLSAGAEVTYETFLAGLHPDDRVATDEVVRRSLSSESCGDYNVEYRTVGIEDGQERWVAARGRAIFDDEGQAVRFVGTVLDITARKKAEEQRDRAFRREREARREAEAASARLELLTQAGAALSSSLASGASDEQLASRVARAVTPGLADWCLVDTLDESGSLHQLAAAHADPGKQSLLCRLAPRRSLDAAGLSRSRRLAARALRSGSGILVPDLTDEMLAETAGDDDDERLALMRSLNARSAVCAPLVARGRIIGAILLVFGESGRRYVQEDLSFVRSLANRCALALDNARLYRGRSRIARALQENLLPPGVPEIPGLEVGLSYRSVGQGTVGGDFYDLFDSGSRRGSGPAFWNAVIGDVCGKGPEAAAVLALARHTLRASARRQTRPSAMLSDLNEALLREGRERGERKFCTAAQVRLRGGPGARHGIRRGTKRGFSLRVVLAGHPAPMLVSASGKVRRLGYPGHAVGVFEDPRLLEQEARLLPGDTLVLFTDGVTEARSPSGDFFGEERLVGLLRDSTGRDAAAVAAAIERAVVAFQEGSPRDDLAVLVLRARQE